MRVALVTALLLLAGACSERDAPPERRRDAGGAADTGVDTGPPVRPLPDAGEGADVLIYAHARDTLYTFSPATLTVAEVGPFLLGDGSAAPFMLDLAVDAEGRVFTSSDDSLYRVDPDTAGCTLVGGFGLESEQLFALSFLAPGEIGPTQTLVGATNAGAYYEVDPDTGATVLLGSYPDGWSSSGDIVSVEGLGTFATVRRTDFPSDVLARIIFATDGSSAVTIVGPVQSSSRDFTQLFGLAFWGRAMYGFSNAGELIEIDRETGAGSLVTTATGTSSFWGAGVTTRAPILF